MKPLLRFLLAFVLLGYAAALRADVLINEVHINPPGTDDEGLQYIEILTVDGSGNPESQTLGNLSVIFVDSNGGDIGNMEETLALEGLQTGSNGLLLIGHGFDDSVPWEIAEETATADFNALAGVNGRGEIGPRNGLTVLLVEGIIGGPGTDMDSNDDGIFNTSYWTRLIDSVGFGDGPFDTDLDIDITPDNISRTAGNVTARNAGAWYGGNINAVSPGGLDLGFDDSVFGGFTGAATPGRPNLEPPSENRIRINEVLVNPPGQDEIDGQLVNFEFIELVSTDGTFESTNGLWLLVVDSNNGGNVVGEVLEAWNLNGFSTGANGLLLLGNEYDGRGNPWNEIIGDGTVVADPPGMGDGDLRDNSGFTLLLVRDFTGSPRDGGISGDDLDPDDDGVLDSTPWDTSEGENGILDSIGFAQIDESGAGEVLQPTYAPADVTQSGPTGFHPDAVFRVGGRLEANSADAWAGGNIGGNSATGIALNPDRYFGEFRGTLSPGQSNPAELLPQPLILLNEIHLDPPGEDGNIEFVELISATGTTAPLHQLSLLAVDVAGAQKGEIESVIDLRGLSTGSRGLLLLGDGYDTLTPWGRPAGVHFEDPQGLDVRDIGSADNETLALLLVENFDGTNGMDLDTDDDGVLDVMPWTVLMDSAAFGSTLVQTDGIANFNSVGFIPDSLSRVPGTVAQNDVGAWFGGTLDESGGGTSVVYDAFFGPYEGEASPGVLNLAAPTGTASILINEVHINPPGPDSNYEFVELISTSGGRQSTNGLTLVLLETAGTSTGEIDEAWSLDGMATGANGLLLLGNNYPPAYAAAELAEYVPLYWDRTLNPSLVPRTPFGDSVNQAVSAVADPPLLGNSDIPDSSFSLLLVRDFTGFVDEDLDENDDGVLDRRPWAQEGGPMGLLDSIGIRAYDSTLPGYTGAMYALADVSQQDYSPDNVSREAGNVTANSRDAWYGGDVEGDEPTGLVFGMNVFGIDGSVTPGSKNASGSSNGQEDSDGDGQSNAAEALAGTDPNDPTDYLRIVSAARTESGVAFSWSSVEGIDYNIEYSPDLAPASWEVISGSEISGEPGTTSFVDTDAERTGRSEGYYRVVVGS